MAGSMATAWVRARKLPMLSRRNVWFWLNMAGKLSTLSIPEQKCPCQKRVIFSWIGQGVVRILSTHQPSNATYFVHQSAVEPSCASGGGDTDGAAETSRTWSTAEATSSPT